MIDYNRNGIFDVWKLESFRHGGGGCDYDMSPRLFLLAGFYFLDPARELLWREDRMIVTRQ